MSNRRQSPIEVGQMGNVWVASLALFGISAIGNSEVAAYEAVLEALRTHAVTGRSMIDAACESCT